MFYAGHDGRRVGEVRSLIAPDHGGCDVLSQIGVFARALRNAAPAGIARDVAHRRIGPGDACRRRFEGGYAGHAFDGGHVPARRNADVHREDRFVAVDDVHAEKHGDSQPRVLDGHLLNTARLCRRFYAEDVAAGAAFDVVVHLFRTSGSGDHAARSEEDALADLLFEGHPFHQFRHLPGGLFVAVERCGGALFGQRGGLGRCRGGESQGNSQGQQKFHVGSSLAINRCRM